MHRVFLFAAPIVSVCLCAASPEQLSPPTAGPGRLKASTFAGLRFRGIGPALMSGRISDIAVDPHDRATWYVAAASGGVWKTTNAGTTWKPVFDNQGSYSIGCVAVDPNNPLVVWVGTGENNSQRSVGYGDGVYKSLDGGKTWEKAGLEKSEHIAKILIDPRNSNVVYVAAQGPLWAPGGDRGLYKTTDGGKTWKAVLTISENTGVTDVCFDPRNPDVLYCAAYQRRRHVWTLIDGGPEGAIYKSTDGGRTWRKLTRGLPTGDIGRIGLAVSPVKPDVVYALIEAEGDQSGFYRSEDGGENWEKRSGYRTASPQYYQEIFADPHRFDRVYLMDVHLMVTEDGGRTFQRVKERYKHVDNHALVFDPQDPDHLLVGCDGGLYETFDRGETWRFFANLPITQFYKVCVDYAEPFYNIYGGTQDNNTQGGPSRTLSIHGITNSDWFVTLGGDGFKPQVDPTDPNIVYSQYQYGGLVRYDRRTGERIDIQPQPEEGEPPLRWNWDSPLLISPHNPKRLYFAANRVYRSDDRGDSWRPISPDLTRKIDRNRLKVMGRIWSVDAVAKHHATSFYGTIVSLTESPLQEGLLYVGSDDGLICITEDGGRTWRKIDTFPGVPPMTYVADLEASRHDPDTVYAVFNNHKMGDFKPYILKSTDRGRTWVWVAGDLPERGSVWSIAEDHEREGLLFAGTEFGIFFTIDGGNHWIRFQGGLPVCAYRDLEIQRRQNDLVAASFGRGFYILDDYTPLRLVSEKLLEQEAVLFPVKDALMYIPRRPLGWREKASQGDGFFTAPNPPFGAVFTYYLRDDLLTKRMKRRKAEREIERAGGDVAQPSWDELRAEDREEPPQIFLAVLDKNGRVIRRLRGSTKAGIHRVAWNLRYPPTSPYTKRSPEEANRAEGPLAAPGTYAVRLERRVDGKITVLTKPQSFRAVPLGVRALSAADRTELLAFHKQTAKLQRAVFGALRSVQETQTQLEALRGALDDTPGAPASLLREVRLLLRRLADIRTALSGDETLRRRHVPTAPSIVQRVQRLVGIQWVSSARPTQTQKRSYQIAAKQFKEVLGKLKRLVEADLERLKQKAEEAGVPWTPGRLPAWR